MAGDFSARYSASVSHMLICLEATRTGPSGGVPRISQSTPANHFSPKKVAQDQSRASQAVAPRGRIRTGRKTSDNTVVTVRNQARNKAERSAVMRPLSCMREPRGHQAGQVFDILAVQQLHRAAVHPPAGQIDAALVHGIVK